MAFPITVTFRNLDRSESLETDIREQAVALERFYDGIHSCRVTVEVPHRHHEHGRQYHVRIKLALRGEELVVNHLGSPHADVTETDQVERKGAESAAVLVHPNAAVRDAFNRAERRLHEFARRQRGDVKNHHVEQ